MENLWDIVLTASFYGTIVGIFILLTKKILKDKLTSRFHCLIWMLLIIKLIVPIGPKSDISIFNKIPMYNSYQAQNYTNKDVYEATKENEKTETIDKNNNLEYSNLYENYAKNDNKDNGLITSIKNYLPFIWIAGVVNILALLLFSQYFLHKKIKLNNKLTSENIKEILSDCKSKMMVERNIDIVVNDFINTPSLVGITNPKILIPSSMTNLSNKELEYIILHELAHYKRKDILFNYILLILQAIHWFNPVIWYLFKRVREDMELATDEIVLIVLDDEEHREYGKAILTVLDKIKSSKLTPGVLGIIEDKNSVKKRIERIKNMKFTKNKMIIFSIVGIIMILLLGGVLLTSAKESTPQKTDYAQILYSYKSQYVGNASNIGNLLTKLPLSKYKDDGMELQTTTEPYGLNMSYSFRDETYELIEKNLYSNSAVLFALIDNLGYVEYEITRNDEILTIKITREDVNKYLKIDVNSIGKDIESFRKFVEKNNIEQTGINDLDYIIAKTLIDGEPLNRGGEIVTEGHVILDTVEEKNSVKVYLVASTGTFGFENGIFTIISGSFSIPMVINIEKDEYGNVDNVNLEMPQDGSYYVSSIREMFPKKLHKDVVDEVGQYREQIEAQQEYQAKAYLNKIGRDAEVQVGHVVKEYVEINVEAENTLFQDSKLADYPSWLGTREDLVDGVRYIYEKSHYMEDGYDFIVYTKKYEDNSMEQYTYKINGSKPELVDVLK